MGAARKRSIPFYSKAASSTFADTVRTDDVTENKSWISAKMYFKAHIGQLCYDLILAEPALC